MQNNLVLTLTGPDRVGLVEAVTKILLERGGNVETSRMARLGGAFAILMQATLPAEHVAGLEAAFSSLGAQGYKITVAQIDHAPAQRQAGIRMYHLSVLGADHEGIVHQVAQSLAQRGINIESMETETTQAAMSGTPLFSMKALVSAPANLNDAEWFASLEETGRQLNVDIDVSAANDKS
jgi:glycine cleavage system transcriptional repressor